MFGIALASICFEGFKLTTTSRSLIKLSWASEMPSSFLNVIVRLPPWLPFVVLSLAGFPKVLRASLEVLSSRISPRHLSGFGSSDDRDTLTRKQLMRITIDARNFMGSSLFISLNLQLGMAFHKTATLEHVSTGLHCRLFVYPGS